LQLQINDLESQREYKLEETKILEFKQDNIQNIQTIKPPAKSPNPVKPTLSLNVVLAFAVGMVVMGLLSFFIEYMLKMRRQRYK
jgi:capsular polysaccharide biosynthesis protein